MNPAFQELQKSATCYCEKVREYSHSLSALGKVSSEISEIDTINAQIETTLTSLADSVGGALNATNMTLLKEKINTANHYVKIKTNEVAENCSETKAKNSRKLQQFQDVDNAYHAAVSAAAAAVV